MNTQNLEVAKTIQEQLFAIDKMMVWSWGANSWTALNNALAFKVQGFKFKGLVKIILTPTDTYCIQFIKGKEVIKEYTDVYFDEMNEIIDNYVEYTGANYENDVNTAVYVFK